MGVGGWGGKEEGVARKQKEVTAEHLCKLCLLVRHPALHDGSGDGFRVRCAFRSGRAAALTSTDTTCGPHPAGRHSKHTTSSDSGRVWTDRVEILSETELPLVRDANLRQHHIQYRFAKSPTSTGGEAVRQCEKQGLRNRWPSRADHDRCGPQGRRSDIQQSHGC